MIILLVWEVCSVLSRSVDLVFKASAYSWTKHTKPQHMNLLSIGRFACALKLQILWSWTLKVFQKADEQIEGMLWIFEFYGNELAASELSFLWLLSLYLNDVQYTIDFSFKTDQIIQVWVYNVNGNRIEKLMKSENMYRYISQCKEIRTVLWMRCELRMQVIEYKWLVCTM